jgi:hypothetical protein
MTTQATTDVTPQTQATVTPSDFYKEESAHQTQAPENQDSAKDAESKDASATDDKAAADGKDGGQSEFKINAPDDFILPATHLEDVTSFAKEHKIDVATAEKILARENNLVKEVLSEQEKAHTQNIQTWINEAKADQEIGGEKLKESAEMSRRALKSFGSEGLEKILNETGYGNHPEVLRIFSRIGRVMANDKMVKGGNETVHKEKPIEDIFYGKSNKE